MPDKADCTVILAKLESVLLCRRINRDWVHSLYHFMSSQIFLLLLSLLQLLPLLHV
ncbi:hypothetical protein DPMN_147996 [Dreissena polymorpha]|uniref:Uncharacterized protein n=1 Tax=Dreissena polymorpha TaxID=45954 RepID=A0A9D4J3I7_DREPO|nr:hypothetical protein DPMN_147996 [Dreissena polymorpha]